MIQKKNEIQTLTKNDYFVIVMYIKKKMYLANLWKCKDAKLEF